MARIYDVGDIVSSGLCLGCGACAQVCPQGAICLVDITDEGLRPTVAIDKCNGCELCMKVCPGIETEGPGKLGHTDSYHIWWGPVLEVYEGYASDPQVRFQGASGGVVTAICLFCLERQGYKGILHVFANEKDPLRNQAVVSTTRQELTKRSGSRYGPAAPCEGLRLVSNEGAYVFVGKPCDIAAIQKLSMIKSLRNAPVRLSIGFFCAGTPCTAGTMELVRTVGLRPDQVARIRYRGYGWPGKTAIVEKDTGQLRELAYELAWGEILSRFVPFRCQMCADSTAELADIACGDAWHLDTERSQPGCSILIVRTPLGRVIVQEALDSGYITAKKVKPEILKLAQAALLKRRQRLWGRLLALRVSGVRVPGYRGFPLRQAWQGLPRQERFYWLFRSLVGALLLKYRHMAKRSVRA